jgi:hypothetical protein
LSLGDLKDILNGVTHEQLDIISRHTHLLLNMKSPLLKLPAEIRNTIYANVIKEHLNAIEPKSCDDQGQKPHFVPALFRVSQQIRSEGLRFLRT